MADSPQIILFSEMVEENGKTVRENNLTIQHKHQLGAIVEIDLDISEPGATDGIEINLKGTCRLFVVGHNRDCDGTPLYIISDIPVRYPLRTPSFSRERLVYRTLARIVEHGYGEEALRPTGLSKPLSDDSAAWLMT